MRVERTKEGFRVESSSRKGEFYSVDPDKPWCDCPAFKFQSMKKGSVCKHILAVREFVAAESPDKEVLAYVEEHGAVDSLDLIERFGEKVVDRLIAEGSLVEKKGKITLLG